MYKRIFFSENTVRAAAISIPLLGILSSILLLFASENFLYDFFDVALKVLLSLFLCRGYQKHELQAMQAGCCGLLVCIVSHQATYVLHDLFTTSMDTYIELGFWGSFFLAGELMLLIIETIITVNHYMIYVLGRRNFLRIRVNETNLLILIAFSALQLFNNMHLALQTHTLFSIGVSHLLVIVLYVLIGCTELILALDDGELR